MSDYVGKVPAPKPQFLLFPLISFHLLHLDRTGLKFILEMLIDTSFWTLWSGFEPHVIVPHALVLRLLFQITLIQ